MAPDGTGSTETFRTVSLNVNTNSPTEVDRTSVTLNGNLTSLSTNTDVWFEWGKVGNGMPNSTSTQSLNSTGSFSEEITGLNPGDDYEFRAIANDGSLQDNGDTLSFVATFFSSWRSIVDGTVFVDIG